MNYIRLSKSKPTATYKDAFAAWPTRRTTPKRDAILIHAIAHRTGLEAVNDKLFDENEKTLY